MVLRDVVAALRRRQADLDHVRVQFEWLMCRAPLRADPFDPSSWIVTPKRSRRYDCTMSIVRPDFRLTIRARPEGLAQGDVEQLSIRTWIDGRRLVLTQTTGGENDVVIDDDRWAIGGPIPYLTLFEFTLFDIQHSLLEILQGPDGRTFQISQTPAGYVRLAGRHEGWELEAELDPQQGWVPLRLRARTDFGRPGKAHADWTLRTVETAPLAGTDSWLIREAIIALDTSTGRGKWMIYHYKMQAAEREASLSRGDLRVEIPKKNVRLWNELTGYAVTTDASGKVIEQSQLTSQQREERRQAIERTRAAIAEANRERERRRSLTTYLTLGGSAAVATLALAGVWLWMRRRSLHIAG